MKLIPSDRLMIETDAPWCGIRPSHASSSFVKTKISKEKDKKKFEMGYLVKGRNEPCNIMYVMKC